MTTEKNDLRFGKKGKTRREIENHPKKFQKLVIETLLKKGGDKVDSSDSEEEIQLPQFIGTTLDLTKKRLKRLPAEILKQAEFVQYLYLEGNRLTELPSEFFECLKNLKWLDLRNNNLAALPSAGLKNHYFLEFLLLQGNRIKNLPVELGDVPRLKGLQITGNPIVNVPYEVIAEGFQSIVNHLRKLNSQDSILLPNSDAIVVKPSTVKGSDGGETKKTSNNSAECFGGGSVEAETDSLVQQGAKLDAILQRIRSLNPQMPFSSSEEIRKLLMKSKMCPRPKQRIIASSFRHQPRRRTRLGYKRKMVTPEMVQEKARKEVQIAKRKETLEKQARKIQRMKDREVLKTWRRQTQRSEEYAKLLDNYQQYPSKNFAMETPFDVDPEFLYMVNRIDLCRSLKELEVLQKNRRKRMQGMKTTIGDLERQMKDITRKLESFNLKDETPASPRTKQRHLCSKIAQMKEIQRTLHNLQYKNLTAACTVPKSEPVNP